MYSIGHDINKRSKTWINGITGQIMPMKQCVCVATTNKQ